MKCNMGSTVHQSTKTTQWTVDRLTDQINSDQSNQSPSQKVSNQTTCKKSQLRQLYHYSASNQLASLWCQMAPLILAILSVNESSVSRKVSQSVHQSISPGVISQLVSNINRQSVDQTVRESINGSVYQSGNQSDSQPISWLVTHLVSWLIS